MNTEFIYPVFIKGDHSLMFEYRLKLEQIFKDELPGCIVDYVRVDNCEELEHSLYYEVIYKPNQYWSPRKIDKIIAEIIDRNRTPDFKIFD
jgi:hypothetical protein